MFNVLQNALNDNIDNSDLLVILQKVTSKEPVLVQSMLTTGLVEKLNQLVGHASDDFVRQNARSVLKMVT
jgi:hypothetical protein